MRGMGSGHGLHFISCCPGVRTYSCLGWAVAAARLLLLHYYHAMESCHPGVIASGYSGYSGRMSRLGVGMSMSFHLQWSLRGVGLSKRCCLQRSRCQPGTARCTLGCSGPKHTHSCARLIATRLHAAKLLLLLRQHARSCVATTERAFYHSQAVSIRGAWIG